jgi:hypothetical protein
VLIEDQENVSPSGTFGEGRRQATITAYQFYELTFQNVGGSTLTNGTVTVRLTDHVVTDTESKDVASTASYVAASSPSFCSPTSTNPDVVTCSLGNIPANSSKAPFFLVYRTSTTPGVVSTTLSGRAAFKEGANGPNGANPATFDISEPTSLEGDPEKSVAWSPPSGHVTMGTSPTFDSQFSTFAFSIPDGQAGFLATTSEGARELCAPDKTCFGEEVTTDLSDAAPGTFSSANVFTLTITMSLDLYPGGNIDNIVLIHLRDDAVTPEIISTHCASNPDTFPCLDVTRDNKAKLLIIVARGFENGGWVPGV